MSKIVKIYCEGKRGSHDYDILDKVIDGLSSIQIDPIGSVRGAGAIIQFKENEITKSSFMLFFRDRDFDVPIPKEVVLEQDEQRKYAYFSYRNTIENYLFSTPSFYEFLVEEKLNEKYAIASIDDVKVKFIAAAEKIKYYQAVRHTMGKMRTGKANFGTKWTEKSGILPHSLKEGYCKKKALEEICKAKSQTNAWSEDNFNEIYLNFIDKFDTHFMDRLDFLIHFQGKDFAASLKLVLPGFPIKTYYKFAKKNFDYRLFKDLVELRAIIKSKL